MTRLEKVTIAIRSMAVDVAVMNALDDKIV